MCQLPAHLIIQNINIFLNCIDKWDNFSLFWSIKKESKPENLKEFKLKLQKNFCMLGRLRIGGALIESLLYNARCDKQIMMPFFFLYYLCVGTFKTSC